MWTCRSEAETQSQEVFEVQIVTGPADRQMLCQLCVLRKLGGVVGSSSC